MPSPQGGSKKILAAVALVALVGVASLCMLGAVGILSYVGQNPGNANVPMTIGNSATIAFDHAKANEDGTYDLVFQGSMQGTGNQATITINTVLVEAEQDQLLDRTGKLISLPESVSPGKPFEVVIRTPELPAEVRRVHASFNVELYGSGGMSSYSMSMGVSESVSLDQDANDAQLEPQVEQEAVP